MLQGTFETLPLAEVLGLLAQSRKTGALWLDAGPASAVVHIVDGRCCAAVSPEMPDPVDNAESLMVRLVELCFGVSRAEDGSFRFASEEPPWRCSETIDLEAANDELGRLLDEWREIQSIIPSLECRIRLAEKLAVEEITIDQARWRLLTAIDGRRTVRDLVRKANRPVLDACHALVALVEAGACTVVQPPAAPARTGRSTGGKANRPVVDPEAPYGPGVESPHPGRAAHVDEDEIDAVPTAEKGQYLRVFSGLRDG